jgi:hypothetical protein
MQASQAWIERHEGVLARWVIVQSDADPSWRIMHGKGGAVLAQFYVDDGLVAARTAKEADALVDLVESVFAIRKLKEPVDFLRIRIQRNWGAGTITLTQKAQALAVMHGVPGACRAVPRVPKVLL